MQLHIRYLRSLEESKRVHEACLQYLQTWFPDFYAVQPDLAAQFEVFARELGGELRTPRFSWKYAWIHSLLGWRPAKRASVALPQVKGSILRRWDKLLYERTGKPSANSTD
jgi:hypothetical protein